MVFCKPPIVAQRVPYTSDTDATIKTSTDLAASSGSKTTLQDTSYIPGFLRTQIGKTIRVEFLIGTNAPLVDRTGVLVRVGTNYILLRPPESDDLLMADLYSIKFVTVYM